MNRAEKIDKKFVFARFRVSSRTFWILRTYCRSVKGKTGEFTAKKVRSFYAVKEHRYPHRKFATVTAQMYAAGHDRIIKTDKHSMDS